MAVRSILFLAALLCLAPGCGSTPYMREALPGEALEAPPAGKALVNIHRPSDYGGHRVYLVFDGTQFVGASRGEERFQYVAEPGTHALVGYLADSIWATVSVIQADLLPDQVYDCVVDAGYFTSSIAVNPLPKGEKRRAKLPDWEEDQTTLVVDQQSNVAEYEADRREDNEEILKDFIGGPKQERVKVLAADDHR